MLTLGKTSYAEERKPFNIDLQFFAEEGESDLGDGELDISSDTDPGILEDSPESEEVEIPVEEDMGSEESDTDEEVDTGGQPPEVNAAFARMRRELERANRLVENIYGEEFGVKSIEELEALYNKMEQEHQQQQYQQTGQIDPNYINSMIDNHPAIRAATQVAEDQRLINNFNDLKKEYPELVKSVDDIPPEVWDQFDKGMSLVDAYTVTNRKTILEFYRNVGKQTTLNNLKSKKHLKTEGDGASADEGVHIPAETLSMYMEMGMSKEEASAHYRKLYE